MDWAQVYRWFLSDAAKVGETAIFMLAFATALIGEITKVVRATLRLVEAVQKLVSRVAKLFRPGEPRVREAREKEAKEGMKAKTHAEEGPRMPLVVGVGGNHSKRKVLRWVSVVSLLFGLSMVVARYLVAQKLPPNARLTVEAWEAFNKGDWRLAIRKAQECIEQFQDDANDEQKKLEDQHATVPNGEVSKEEKEEILRRGPLNDVATCFWIRGQAAEKLGQNGEAKEAYQAAANYTYARCFDPSWNGFWSPSDKAKSRLKHLK